MCIEFHVHCVTMLTHTHSDLDHGLSEPQIKCISKQMFTALHFLHESGCIHRDLKAGNVLLMSDGTIRLGKYMTRTVHPKHAFPSIADFGVSTKDQTRGKNKHDTFIGTPYWYVDVECLMIS